MSVLWRLLRSHVSLSQTIGFWMANLTGMVIILCGVQLYQDMLPLFRGNEAFFKKEYLVVSKPVTTFGSLLGSKGTFSDGEVEDLRDQPFVRSVGIFRPSLFDVSASLGMQGTGIHVNTDMFFESVPDAYVDVAADRWQYVPGSRSIPIVIPRTYLNLYNFGFAQSRGLPKLSEGMLSMIRLQIRLSGKGVSESYEGRIVGFSNRLNTILVPEAFMDWANVRYAPGRSGAPSRLIVEVDNPADEAVVHYMDQHRYEVENDRLEAGKAMWLLRTGAGVVLGVGLVIVLLSLYILMLSIYLLLQKNTERLQSLLLIGYSVRQVAWPYQVLAFVLNLSVWVASFLFVWGLRELYGVWLSALLPNRDDGSLWLTAGIGLGICLLASGLNLIVIHQKVSKIWKIK